MPSTASRSWILGLAALATFMVALDTLVVTTALTTIQRDLGASVEQLDWTVNAYNLAFAVFILTASALGDRLGRRRIFASGIALFTLASAACALSETIGVLIAARVVQGLGAAMVMPLALTLVSAAFPPEQRGKTLGILGGLTGLAVAMGPLVGGAVVEGLDWSWIFWVNVPIGIVVIPLVLRKVPESRVPSASIDPLGLGFGTLAALGLAWGLSRGNAAGWASVEVLIAFGVSGFGALAFVAVERVVPGAMLPMEFFRSRAFSAGNAAAFMMIGSLFGAVFLMAQFLQTVLGSSPLEAGLQLLPWTATPLLIAPLAGAAADRIGPRPVLTAGLALQGGGLAWVALASSADVTYGQLVVPLIVAGVGISMAIPSAQTAVIGSVPDEAVGKASGTNSTARELGGVFGIAIAVAVFAGNGNLASPAAFADGFGPALLAAAGLSLVGCLVAVLLPGSGAVPADAGEPALAGAGLSAARSPGP